MYSTSVEILQDGRVEKHAVLRGGTSVPHGEIFELWRMDSAFRLFFTKTLAACPFPALRWETPPVTGATLGRPFEFVLLRSAGLDRPADRRDFAEKFATASADDEVIAFDNLGRNALMVVPLPRDATANYCHLAAFLRTAPASGSDALWRVVGESMQRRVGERPVWLSTAGGGVAWLHVRLDSTPKYYGFEPYTKVPGEKREWWKAW